MIYALYDIIEKLDALVRDRGRGLNELAQAWLMVQPQVCSVISGVSSLEQVFNNATAANWALSTDDVKEINAILSLQDPDA